MLLVTGFGVWASLNAEATGVQSVNTGTLRLSLVDTGSAGFAQTVANMGAADTQSRYVTLTNNGTLAGRGLAMKVVASGDSVLITDTADTKALRVTVSNCTEAWVNGACAPGAATVLNAVALSALASPNAFAGLTTANAGDVLNLKVTVALPEQDELYRDGVFVPEAVGAGSVQGAKATLNYTFSQTSALLRFRECAGSALLRFRGSAPRCGHSQTYPQKLRSSGRRSAGTSILRSVTDPAFASRPFRAEAVEAGLTPRQVNGSRFRLLRQGRPRPATPLLSGVVLSALASPNAFTGITASAAGALKLDLRTRCSARTRTPSICVRVQSFHRSRALRRTDRAGSEDPYQRPVCH